MDPVVEAILLAIAKVAPTAIIVIADALKGGDTPEQAVTKARLAVPPRLDTTAKDDKRRRELLETPPEGTKRP